MSDQTFYAALQQKLDTLKTEGVLASRQGAEVVAADGRTLINMCANNYLGLSGDRETQKAAEAALQKYGYGLSSVRFICGT